MRNWMKAVLTIVVVLFSASAFAQWQPSGATSGPITYTGGNVGVNTATPTESLHVGGNVKVSGAAKIGARLISPLWWNSGDFATGYIKLVTPIVHNESNMFSIGITAYRYHHNEGQTIDIHCTGYAFSGTTLIRATCTTDGTELPVEISTEVRAASPTPVVVVRIGAPDTIWYYGQFTFQYVGWVEKSPGGFTWVKGEPTPAIGTNMNRVVLDDPTGTLALGGAQTAGTRLTVGGTSHLTGNLGIGIAPNAVDRLAISGPADTTSFAGTPLTTSIASSNPHNTPNGGAGIAFKAVYNTAGAQTQIAAVSGVKESTVDGNYAGALTFGTRQHGTGSVSMERMRIRSTGEVVIGQSGNVGTKLTVNGDTVANGTVTGIYIKAHYQDVAEWVPSRDDLAPGTVVVLDAEIGNAVMASHRAYDTAVAGVVSAQPGIILGEEGTAKEQVATTGRVRVKVDASRGPIAVGDLLVTSDKAGYAMRSAPIAVGGAFLHQPGTIVGKALEPLRQGEGEILVLLSLQ